MWRVTKPEGFGNICLEEAPVPQISERQVLVRTRATLISRGSELFRRYNQEEAVPSSIMGYSLAGVVERTGAAVTEHRVGDRVMVVAPHAEYVVGDAGTSRAAGMVVPLPDEVSFEEGTFLPLATSSLAWAESSGVREGDTVVVLGQGLVGSLMLQTLRRFRPARIVAVDALPLRCEFAERLGADAVIRADEQDPVAAVRDLTGAEGADLVVDCVGGPAGVESFRQAQAMARPRGTIHLIALYHGAPLSLDASAIMNRRLLAGILTDEPREQTARRAVELIRDGTLRVREMITHRFPFRRAKEAFDLLWKQPGEALGVILDWTGGVDSGQAAGG